MKVERSIVVFVLMVVMFVGCGHQAPQMPSQRKGQEPQVDSAALALLQLNQQLAETADRELTALAQEQDSAFALYEAGTWMRIMSKGDETTPTPQANEEWTIRMRVYDLKMQLLEDSEASYRIGKKELPQAVEENIGELHHGAQARLLAPWYTAFGLRGTDRIPPYENVIIDIELR